ncbi:hypothetical protein SAMN02745181_2439 [Rubritalea squalenifaciens DSM 18772]|uniref:DUF5069 domain-containing protein n=3 Tax=Rubritaleaceae TaxID=1648490 RepID=A0A1M6LLX3_9BACT|nr:hypothetical protein SAMN02745181_2439 [Rubritalea squalenifaciens DSM 18772]
MTWNDHFLKLFRRCLEAYRGGNSDFNTYYSDDDLTFLASIGYKPRELFDFVEDLADDGEPTESTALLIAAVRRDYLMVVQNNILSEYEITMDELPGKQEETDGIAYLPRIIAKAEHKLRGELDPNIMFGCGGDRNFFRRHGNIHPADFLRHVWAADGDHDHILDYVKSQPNQD